MADKNYVCTVCSQTFTRMWRGKVHNANLHAGQGQIVRLIDYMVGRLSGLYLPGNPSDYRKKNGSLISGSPQNPENLSSSALLEQTQEGFIKTAKVKEILDRHYSQNEVKEILSLISCRCYIRGDNGPLDDALRRFSKADEVRKAKDYLMK